MKVKINISFHDINDFGVNYAVGEIVDFDEQRAIKLLSLGYVAKVEEAKEEEPEMVAEDAPVEADDKPKTAKKKRR